MQLVAWNLAGGSSFFSLYYGSFKSIRFGLGVCNMWVWRPVKAAVVVIDQFVGASLSVTIIIILITAVYYYYYSLFIHHQFYFYFLSSVSSSSVFYFFIPPTMIYTTISFLWDPV